MHTYTWYATFVALYAASTALADDAAEVIRCGIDVPGSVRTPSNATIGVANGTYDGRTLNIHTFFHIVARENQTNLVSSEMIEAQLVKMNETYDPHGISFHHNDTSYTVEDNWATGGDIVGMSKSLRRGGYGDLNLYFLSDFNTTSGFIGLCSFPYDNVPKYSDLWWLDGCQIHAPTMPGGDLTSYNLGTTATHEIGHWFGLYHVFEGENCDPETDKNQGDRVSDTPRQKKRTQGCPPVVQDSCPEYEGVDSIHNYMDYSTDDCVTEFTEGQAYWMYWNWDIRRSWLRGAD